MWLPPPLVGRARRGRIALRLALSVAATLLLLGALELGARLVVGDEFVPGPHMGRPADAIARHHADLGWVNAPGVRTRVSGPSFSYIVTHNERGLRDRDHPYEKPAGVLRVLALGDSVTWGWGVNDGEEWPALVEAELGPDVEVINLGVPAYSTDQELWLLETEGRRYDPDLVLLCFVLNDVHDSAAGGGGGMQQTKPWYERGPEGEWERRGHPASAPEGGEDDGAGGAMRWIRENSAFLDLAWGVDAEQQLAAGAAALERGGNAPARELEPHERAFLEEHEAAIRALGDELVAPDSLTRWLLGRVAERCEELGTPLAAFSVAHHHDRYLYAPSFPRPDGVEDHLAPGAAPYRTHLSRRLAEAGAAEGFETFAVDQAMLEQVAAGVDLNAGDGHLNARGNRVVAQRVIEELRRMLGEPGG